jgi:TolA-binding protein
MKLILDNSSKVQELELQVEKERRTFHESKLEISNLEEKLQNCKHENVLLNSKVEEMSFNEIETQEKIKKLQESYEGQVESLSASQQEIKSKWKDKWRTVSRELDIATEQLKDLENTTEQQETELDSLRSHNEVLSGKVIDHESTLVEKNNLIKQQKHMI